MFEILKDWLQNHDCVGRACVGDPACDQPQGHDSLMWICRTQERPQLMDSPRVPQSRTSPSPSSRSSQQLPEWISDLNKPLTQQRRCTRVSLNEP